MKFKIYLYWSSFCNKIRLLLRSFCVALILISNVLVLKKYNKILVILTDIIRPHIMKNSSILSLHGLFCAISFNSLMYKLTEQKRSKFFIISRANRRLVAILKLWSFYRFDFRKENKRKEIFWNKKHVVFDHIKHNESQNDRLYTVKGIATMFSF